MKTVDVLRSVVLMECVGMLMIRISTGEKYRCVDEENTSSEQRIV